MNKDLRNLIELKTYLNVEYDKIREFQQKAASQYSFNSHVNEVHVKLDDCINSIIKLMNYENFVTYDDEEVELLRDLSREIMFRDCGHKIDSFFKYRNIRNKTKSILANINSPQYSSARK